MQEFSATRRVSMNAAPGSAIELLFAISRELSRTADEISTLGEIVRADSNGRDSTACQRRAEAFDLLKRKCALHADLVHLSARAVGPSGRGLDNELQARISAAPFQPLRARLLEAVRQSSGVAGGERRGVADGDADPTVRPTTTTAPIPSPQAQCGRRLDEIHRLADRLRNYAKLESFAVYSAQMTSMAGELERHAARIRSGAPARD